MNIIMLLASDVVPDTSRYMFTAYLVIGLMISGYIASLAWRWRRINILIEALKVRSSENIHPEDTQGSEIA